MNNKFEKFMLAFSGFLMTVLAVMGFKLNEQDKKIADLISTPADPGIDSGLSVQNAIRNNRDKKLNTAAHAPLTDSNTQTTIKTVIPGKTITQTVPATSSSSSSSAKKTKTS